MGLFGKIGGFLGGVAKTAVKIGLGAVGVGGAQPVNVNVPAGYYGQTPPTAPLPSQLTDFLNKLKGAIAAPGRVADAAEGARRDLAQTAQVGRYMPYLLAGVALLAVVLLVKK